MSRDLNSKQKVLLARVTKSAQRLHNARMVAEQRLRDALVAELAELRFLRDNEVREAYAEGISKANLKRALGTSDHATLQKILEGFDLSKFEVKSEKPEFTYNPETQRLTIYKIEDKDADVYLEGELEFYEGLDPNTHNKFFANFNVDKENVLAQYLAKEFMKNPKVMEKYTAVLKKEMGK